MLMKLISRLNTIYDKKSGILSDREHGILDFQLCEDVKDFVFEIYKYANYERKKKL